MNNKKSSWEKFLEESAPLKIINKVSLLFKYMDNEFKEKEIHTSGSIPGNKLEMNRAGQAYLYRKNGEQSTVFDIRMKDQVFASPLQQALDMALKRYPYFCSQLKEKNGDFYFVPNVQPCIARQTKRLHSLGSMSANYHLIDVTFYENSIYLSFHHALCDGMGFKPFIETLLYYYFGFRYHENEQVEGIRLSGEPLLAGETMDPFLKPYEVDESYMQPQYDEERLHLPETVKQEEEQTTYYRYEVNVSREEFIAFCKNNHATPSIAASLLMSNAIRELFPEDNRAIFCNLASDMRKELHMENTFKNCVISLLLPYGKTMKNLTFSEQAEKFRQMLNEQRHPENAKRNANVIWGLGQKLDAFESYKEKKKIMGFFDGLFLDTYIISYIGRLNLGIYEKYVKSAHLYNSGTTGLAINMIDASGNFTFDFLQSFPSDKYVRAFVKELDKHCLGYMKSECIPFTTPCDSIQKISHLSDNV